MEIRFATFGGQSESFLKLLASHSPLENTMELLRVDVEGRLLCGTCNRNLGRLLLGSLL